MPVGRQGRRRQWQRRSRSRAGESGLRLKAVGRYRKLPLRADLRTAGVLGLFVAGKDAQAQPLRLLASIGGADLSFSGSTTDPLHFAGLKGRFDLSGPSLATVGDVLGITLPTTPSFKTVGTVAKDGAVWNAVFDSAAIGSSRLTGAFTFDPRPKVPLLAGRIAGARLLLADLGPAVGTPNDGAGSSARPGRVIPDKHFDLPSLRAMDANVLVDIAMFDVGTTLIEPLRPAQGPHPSRRWRADGGRFRGRHRRWPAAWLSSARRAWWPGPLDGRHARP